MTDDPFLRDLLAKPDDRQTRQVYADWLEERGDPRGEFLRLEDALAALPKKDPSRQKLQTRLRELRAAISPEWLAQLDKARIENCGVEFEFQCPKQWEELKPTETARVRFCDACQRNVYHCATVQEAQEHADRRECVAVDSRVVRVRGDLVCPNSELRMVMGELPLVPPGRLLGRVEVSRRGGEAAAGPRERAEERGERDEGARRSGRRPRRQGRRRRRR
jgi:uncharacterized protein (TIGR02996 family)